jgi:hypothetical protein
MVSKLALSYFVVSVMACAPPGGGPGPGPGGGDDDGSNTPDAPLASHLTVSGTAKEQGQSGASPLSGVTIAAYQTGLDTPLAMATSDATGNFSFVINDGLLDGYLKATKSGYTDTYIYPAAPLNKDTTVETSLLSTSTFGLLVTFAGGDSSKGVIIAIVADANGTPVSGAKVTSTPSSGVYKYSDGTGAPTSTSGTPADGTAFFLSAPLGAVMVSATKSGATFKQHMVTTHNNALVTTTITE